MSCVSFPPTQSPGFISFSLLPLGMNSVSRAQSTTSLFLHLDLYRPGMLFPNAYFVLTSECKTPSLPSTAFGIRRPSVVALSWYVGYNQKASIL